MTSFLWSVTRVQLRVYRSVYIVVFVIAVRIRSKTCTLFYSRLARGGALSPHAFITGAILASESSTSSFSLADQTRGPSKTAGCTEPKNFLFSDIGVSTLELLDVSRGG